MERKGSKDLAKSSTFLVDQSYLGQAPKTFLIDRSDCDGDNVMFVADEVFVHGVSVEGTCWTARVRRLFSQGVSSTGSVEAVMMGAIM